MHMTGPIGIWKQKIPVAGSGSYGSIKRPITAAQWSGLCGYAPDYLWECQESSGNLLPTIGTSATLTKNSTGQSYQLSVTNWFTKWVGTTLASAHGWASPSNLFTLHNTSLFVLVYFCLTNSDGSVRSMVNLRSGDDLNIRARNSNPGIQMVINGSAANTASVYENATPTPHAMAFIYDRSTSLWRTRSDLQQGTGTYAAMANASRTFGIGQMGAEQNAAGARYNLIVAWKGANAEAMTARGGAGLGGTQLLTDLGWI